MQSILLEDNPHWVDKNSYGSFVPLEILKKALKSSHFRKIKGV